MAQYTLGKNEHSLKVCGVACPNRPAIDTAQHMYRVFYKQDDVHIVVKARDRSSAYAVARKTLKKIGVDPTFTTSRRI